MAARALGGLRSSDSLMLRAEVLSRAGDVPAAPSPSSSACCCATSTGPGRASGIRAGSRPWAGRGPDPPTLPRR